MSSNIKNTAFYNSVGFNTVAEIVLGDTNPEWEHPPVIICLVSLFMLEDYLET